MHQSRSSLAGKLLLGSLAAILSASTVSAADLLERPGPSVAMAPLAEGAAPTGQTGTVEVFVRLDDPSIAAYAIQAMQNGGSMPSAEQQKAHAAMLDQAQARVRSQLAGMGAVAMSRMRAGDNGIRVRVDSSQVQNLASIPGVKGVAPMAMATIDLSNSVPWIGADVVQAAGLDGTGVTVGIIDTGIDYLHANMGGSGDPDEYAANDPNVIEAGTFPTAKVVGGWDWAGPIYDASSDDPALNTPQPDPDPLDGNGHGSHVAGITGGLGVEGKIGVGVAPGVSLYALKVFGDIDGSTLLTADAIEFAIDPNGDGDTSDHLDVINMSLGSSSGDPSSPSAVASNNAADIGVIVVASAGNSGPTPYITGSPGVASKAISVASSLSGGDVPGFSAAGDVSGSYEVREGVGAVRVADGAVTSDLMAPSDPENVFGCAAIEDDMTGYIALISRGGCSFDDKYINAQAAGAVAILVYNDGAAADRIAPIIMGGVGDLGVEITIPGVMTTAFAGYEIAAALDGGGSVSATLDDGILVDTLFGDTISAFSSSGPGQGGSGFKPDVTAPGDAITSTLVGSGTESLTIGGTSMAAPHIAGIAALLHEQNQYVVPRGVKAIMQNATRTAAGDGTVGATPALSRQGVGVTDAAHAVGLSSYATPGGVSFGRVNPRWKVWRKETFWVRNMRRPHGKPRTYKVEHIPNQTFPGVEVRCPSSVTVEEWRSAPVEIKLIMDPKVGPYDDAFHSQTEVDGWCVLNDGTDELRVGYMAVVDPASSMNVQGKWKSVQISNGNTNVGWAEGFTLAATDGLLLQDEPNAFDAVGTRTNSFAAEGDMVEFGISTDRIRDTLAPYEVDIFVDVDKDGVDDFILVAADFFEDGIPVTAIFPQAAALFSVGSDYNDAGIILSFFGSMDAPLGNLGFLPPGDTDFDYTAVFIDLRSGAADVQFGSVDLDNELKPESNSFGLPPNVSVKVPVAGPRGRMLWLFQNNEAINGKVSKQRKIVTVYSND